MITAVDTSSLIGYLGGAARPDTDAVGAALERGDAVLPPLVVTEILSQPALPPAVADLIRSVTMLELMPGYWERAGLLRARILAARRRARVADTLIAQVCLDHDVALATHDRDFRHFAEIGGLRLVVS